MGGQTTILEVVNLECVRGDRRLFRDINFSLKPGSILHLTGPNGSGKTSLLRIVSGLMQPANGEVRWKGAKIRALAEEYSANVAYVGHRNAVKEELTSVENLCISSGLSGIELNREQARQALVKVGLAGRENLPARYLSEGQRRRSVLARLLTGASTLWLLDEVLASLDSAASVLIESIIGEHLSKGGMAIAATHQELHIAGGSVQRLELGTGVPSNGRTPGGQS